MTSASERVFCISVWPAWRWGAALAVSTRSACAGAGEWARAAGSHGPGGWKRRPCRIPALTPGSCSRRLPGQPNLWHNIPGRRTAVCSAASALCSRLRPPGFCFLLILLFSFLSFSYFCSFICSRFGFFCFSAASGPQFFPGGSTEAEVARSQGHGVEAKRLPEEVSHLTAA